MPRTRSKVVGLTLAGAIALLPVCARNDQIAIAPKATASLQVTSACVSVSVSAALASSASSNGPRDIVIYDSEHPTSNKNRSLKYTVRIDTRDILDQVFHRGSSKGQGLPCEFKLDRDLERQRKAGDITPGILQSIEGSFTAPGHPQVLYVIFDEETDASHAQNWGTNTYAVFEDGHEVACDVGYANMWIENIVDIDGDGQDEIVASDGFTNQGVSAGGVTIARFKDGKLSTVRRFLGTDIDDCNTIAPHAENFMIKTSVIHLLSNPDHTYDFRVDKTTKPCAPTPNGSKPPPTSRATPAPSPPPPPPPPVRRDCPIDEIMAGKPGCK